MIARCRDTVSTPAACSSAVSLRVWIIVMNDSVTSRWSRRAAIPSAGTSRIQLSITAGRDSALAIQASTACRICTAHGAAGLTAAEMVSMACRFVSVSSATRQASRSEKYS